MLDQQSLDLRIRKLLLPVKILSKLPTPNAKKVATRKWGYMKFLFPIGNISGGQLTSSTFEFFAHSSSSISSFFVSELDDDEDDIFICDLLISMSD